jgi:translation initiation factor IF-3
LKRIRFRHKQNIRKPNLDIYPLNEKIRAPEVRVIDENDQMIGVLATPKAIEMAKERDLDLVAVSPKANPPVAKFIDYGNFKYQQEKAAKKQKSKEKRTEVKDIRLSPRIGKHDLDVRLKQAEKFLSKGDKLTVEVILKGRERKYPELAKDVINQFIAKVQNDIMEIKIEQEPKRQGNKFMAIIYPDKSASKEETKEGESTDNETESLD